jgi:hypothetical protein
MNGRGRLSVEHAELVDVDLLDDPPPEDPDPSDQVIDW